MTRVTKNVDDRRLEIVETASELFQGLGYENTSISAIIEKMGVAKGTFYYYFKSKEEVLTAVVEKTLDQIVEVAEKIVKDKKLSAIKKLEKIISRGNKDNKQARNLSYGMHGPENRALHERTNIQIVHRFSPLLFKIVKQGKEEGLFRNECSLETVQFLVCGSQFFFDDGLFPWSEKEWKARRLVMQSFFEDTLGAQKGSMKFIMKK